MEIIFSNRVEELFKCLKEQLFLPGQSAFARRLVVVPSPAVKNWLTVQFAQDVDFQISMGIEISFLEQTLSQLRSSFGPTIPSLLALSLAIEKEIRRSLDEEKDAEIWLPLWNYLGKKDRRLISLSETLAVLFQQYGVYGYKMVLGWEKEKKGEWQGKLWRSLFCEGRYPWSYPARVYDEALVQPFERETYIYLFSMSYLSRVHHQFLEKLSVHVPVRYYLLSPCQTFWSDILSDREAGWLQRYWKKRGVSEVQQQDLEFYLSDRNPLLANYGRLGREMARILEDGDVVTDERYQFVLENPTILEAIQADMGLMRQPSPMQADRSVQVHQAIGRLHEVQVVRDLVIEWMEEKGIFPEDIIVMAPRISDYAPYIKGIFTDIDFQIMDLTNPMHHDAIQGFMHLLRLPSTRWDAPSILELFEYDAFQKKQGLKASDVEQIRLWMRKTGVSWGTNAQHRQSLLERDHQNVSLVDKRSSGTWEEAIGTLLEWLVLPAGKMDISQADLLGKWIDILRQLQKDLRYLHDGTRMNIEQWVSYLKVLGETYFAFDSDTESSLLEQLNQFQVEIGVFSVRFPSIQKRLEGLLSKQQKGYRESHLHAVRFCSMLPMRAIPARAIVLMGMEEGTFPKKEMHLSLNKCRSSEVEFCPSQTDYDRFLFLEALLSARDFLCFTFQGISQEDGCEQPPNMLVNELLSYIKRSYHVEIPIETHVQKSFGPQKTESHQFLNGVSKLYTDSVSLKQLNCCAKNPLRTYLNEALEIYLYNEEEALDADEKFQLSGLERYQIKTEALKGEVISKENMPPGVFGEIEEKKIRLEVDGIQRHLAEMNISDFFAISLSEDCMEPHQDENGDWEVPALEVNGIKITGKLADVTSKGLWALTDSDQANLIKLWPNYLVFHEIVKKNQLPIIPNLILGKDGIVKTPFHSMQHLNEYLKYFDQCRKAPSYLLSDWIVAIVTEDEKLLKKVMQEQSYDPYLKWIYRNSKIPEVKEVFSSTTQAKILYSDLLTHWCENV